MQLGLASLVASLTLLAACYDFSLPDDGGTGGATSSASSGGGAAEGGGGAMGSGGQTSYPPPCDDHDCTGCVVCTLAFFEVEEADCAAYDACVTACSGDALCEVNCQGSEPLGFFAHNTLDNECGEVCAGPVPCSSTD